MGAKTHQARILGKYEISYFLCPVCDLLQTEDPFWLEEAYQDSISNLDTGLIHRNLMVSRRVAIFFFRRGLKNMTGCDFAGGYGILVRMLRDLGLDFFWSDKYSPNLAARGFEMDSGKRCDVITAFEVLEHFDRPDIQIRAILESDPKFFLFETTLREAGKVPSENWKYYSLGSGQHIAFYSHKTLDFLAKRHGYFFYREGRLLVFSKSKIRLTDRVTYWLRTPGALFRVFFPDSIPYIQKDREFAERSLTHQAGSVSSLNKAK